MNPLLHYTRRTALIAAVCLLTAQAPRAHALYSGAGYQALAVSADGASLAAGGGDGEVCVWDTAGAVTARLATGAQVHSLIFVRDAATLVVGTGHGLQIWRRTGSEFTRLTS